MKIFIRELFHMILISHSVKKWLLMSWNNLKLMHWIRNILKKWWNTRNIIWRRNLSYPKNFPERTDNIEQMISPESLEQLKWESDHLIQQEPEDAYKNKSRLCGDVLLQSQRPIDIFMCLFPIWLWNKIALESDRYRQKQGWDDIKMITSTDIMVFTGLLIIRSLNI